MSKRLPKPGHYYPALEKRIDKRLDIAERRENGVKTFEEAKKTVAERKGKENQ
jgi:hypothetical protein